MDRLSHRRPHPDGNRSVVEGKEPLNKHETRLESAEAAGVLVAVDSPVLSDATWHDALPRPRKTAATAAILDSVVTVRDAGDLTCALLDQLGLLRQLTGGFDVETTVRTARNYLVTGRSGDAVVSLGGTVAPESSVRLEAVGTQERRTCSFRTDGPAVPTVVTLFDARGAHSARLRYESGRRASWLALHAALRDGTVPPHALRHFLDDVRLISAEAC